MSQLRGPSRTQIAALTNNKRQVFFRLINPPLNGNTHGLPMGMAYNLVTKHVITEERLKKFKNELNKNKSDPLKAWNASGANRAGDPSNFYNNAGMYRRALESLKNFSQENINYILSHGFNINNNRMNRFFLHYYGHGTKNVHRAWAASAIGASPQQRRSRGGQARTIPSMANLRQKHKR